MRSEGWLRLKIGSGTEARRYVVIEGFVLRAFTEQPSLSDFLTPAAAIVDLRMADIKPSDQHDPAGPCELTAKGAQKSLILTSETGFESVEGNWWLPILAAAVPDRACAASIRARFRKPDMVLAMMAEHVRNLCRATLALMSTVVDVSCERLRQIASRAL